MTPYCEIAIYSLTLNIILNYGHVNILYRAGGVDNANILTLQNNQWILECF